MMEGTSWANGVSEGSPLSWHHCRINHGGYRLGENGIRKDLGVNAWQRSSDSFGVGNIVQQSAATMICITFSLPSKPLRAHSSFNSASFQNREVSYSSVLPRDSTILPLPLPRTIRLYTCRAFVRKCRYSLSGGCRPVTPRQSTPPSRRITWWGH